VNLVLPDAGGSRAIASARAEHHPPLPFAARRMSPGLEFRLPVTSAGFKLLRLLGSGGMGSVFEAEELSTGRHVAMKVLPSWHHDSEVARERFEREAKLAAGISHPNVVFVYGVHTIEDAPAISMELMTGETLADQLLTDPPPPVHRIVAWMIQVIDGLEAAHKAGVLHRDIKPANCFVAADGRVKIGDFGLARATDGESSITNQGSFIGTPLFASPEQARGRPLDVRSDIYAVGATLYALLTGAPAFSGGDASETLARILVEEPADPRSLRPDLPPALGRIVQRAMHKDPNARYPDYTELRRVLVPFANEAHASAEASTANDLRPQLKREAKGALDRFEVKGVVGTTPRGRVLLARDPELDRDVWIHLLSPLFGTQDATPALGGRPATSEHRVRLIKSERVGRSPYDVYEAVGGASLRKAVLQDTFSTWINAHPMLLELCEYLVATPMPLHFEQLWVDHNGRVRVLDFALATSPEPRMEPLDLLARVVRELLQSASHPGAIEGIPARSGAMLARLADAKQREKLTLASVYEELRSPSARPIRLTLARRVAQMACAGASLAFMALAIARAAAVASDGSSAWTKAPTLAEFDRAHTPVTVAIGASIVLAIALAAKLGGAAWLSLFRLGLRMQGGRPASGARCAARAAIAWAPLLAALATWNFDTEFARTSTQVVFGLAAFFYGAQFASSFAQPGGSLVDRLAGTRIAPK
jgi:hypothetical protein